jgi:uncharacterized protein
MKIFIYFLFSSIMLSGQTITSNHKTTKMKILVHITQGPENPTRAALGFLIAKTAIEEGHEVNIFLAGDGVNLIKEDVLSTLVGVGTGKLSEHFESIVKGNGRFYLSGNSSKARGITEAELAGIPAEFALPNVLVRLSVESDRMFVY